MTAFTPVPRVTVNSVNFDNIVDVNINISAGRASITEQPQPSFTTIDIYVDLDNPISVVSGAQIVVSLNKSSGTYVPLFTGYATDIDVSVAGWGQVGGLLHYAITCVGSLADVQRHTAGGAGYQKELDGVRILNILTEAFLSNWTDVTPTLTWQALPSTTTWNSYDGNNIALVDSLASTIDSGQYELEAYSGGEANAADLLEEAANSGRGVLWGAGDGTLHYDQYISRDSNPIVTLTDADIEKSDLTFTESVGTIVNDVQVTYRAGTETARDEQSVILYGQLEGSKDTILHNQSDAATQAAAYLASRAYPRRYPKTLTVCLHSPTVSNTTRDELIDVYCGMRINASGLPIAFGSTFDGFVENWTWRIGRSQATLTLGCSAYSETYPELVWLQVSPTYSWTSYGVANPTKKWSDL